MAFPSIWPTSTSLLKMVQLKCQSCNKMYLKSVFDRRGYLYPRALLCEKSKLRKNGKVGTGYQAIWKPRAGRSWGKKTAPEKGAGRSRELFWSNSSSSKIHKHLRAKRDGELMRVKDWTSKRYKKPRIKCLVIIQFWLRCFWSGVWKLKKPNNNNNKN